MTALSTAEAAAVIAAVVTIGLPATYLQVLRARRHESTRDQIVRLAHERAHHARHLDPRALAEKDLEDHLHRFLLEHPDLADQYARLDRAKKGEL
ncbi:hypothetical protein ABZ650_20365 [Streptomyces griseoviridis]|uniref:hypothetical protein n=1 Tax=Streptomyces griseoviridis TaxID=45398 RepID=UPI0033C30653